MINCIGQIGKTDMIQDVFDAGAEGQTLYTEDPWFYGRGDLYYMVYAVSGIPETIAYSTSSKPSGPWNHRGIIMGNKEHGGAHTNHPGVIDFKGKCYFSCHSDRLPGGGGFTRVCLLKNLNIMGMIIFPIIKMSNDGPNKLDI